MDMFEFFINEYKEEAWDIYICCFEEVGISIEGIPQDIVNCVLNVLGKDAGYNWLYSPLHKFNGKSAVELLKIPKGEMALKAYIMRLPI